MTVRHHGDLSAGETRELGVHAFTEDGIRAFAEQFDPQPIHTDPDAADGPFEGVVASGWHTGAVSMRLLVEGYLSEVAAVAGKGLDGLRWPTPVRPGDEMAARVEVVGKEARSDAGAHGGEVRLRVTGETRRGTVVAYTAIALVARA